MSVEQESHASPLALAEALRASAPPSQAITELAKRIVKARQSSFPDKGFLAETIAAVQPTIQTRGALAEALKAVQPSVQVKDALAETIAAVQPTIQAREALEETLKAIQPSIRDPRRRAVIEKNIAAARPHVAALARVGMVRPQPPSPARLPTIQNPLFDPQLPVPRRRQVVRRRTAPTAPRVLPHEVGEVIARGLVRSARQAVIAFLSFAGLEQELEHLGAIEERLSTGTRPAQFHAALSMRLLLEGVADHCFLRVRRLGRVALAEPIRLERSMSAIGLPPSLISGCVRSFPRKSICCSSLPWIPSIAGVAVDLTGSTAGASPRVSSSDCSKFWRLFPGPTAPSRIPPCPRTPGHPVK